MRYDAEPILTMRGIDKQFSGVHALRSVCLDVYEGQVVALVGENGAGKSTLMNVLGGVVRPDAGQIRIRGREVGVRDVRHAMALGIAFIHQELHSLDNLDVAGNIFLGREPRCGGPLQLIDRRRLYAAARPYLERLGLAVSPETGVASLSLAQRQQVEIARALSLDARILIMDEPTSSLTPTETDRLLAIIRDLRAAGVSVIYISHRLSEVRHLADRVEVLRDGCNVGSLCGDEIQNQSMVRLMVGRDLAIPQRTPAAVSSECFAVRGLRTKAHPDAAISFSVSAGQILGFAGLVGAGRSEVARSVCGIDPRLSGQIRLAGRTLRIESARDAIDQGIYLVPEDRRRSGLIAEMNVRENISLANLGRYARWGWIDRAAEARAAAGQCRALNVATPSPETKARNLSGGNQQKIVLGKWLSMRPKVIFLDEPTRGIDVGAKAEIYQLMRQLAARGVFIVMISSDMEELLSVSDRIVVMHEGRITGAVDREAFCEETIMHWAVGSAEAETMETKS
ncbi:MAG: sugar ABC transporter ATP-binding protein [Sedimentisphaerales bacterium]|jgi:ribose transport system ATP-binding protein|nr:sugar ABC transporter ATP-binding protein [Planctomycetota bacterium]MDY0354304.1 sugar ABC transporter ATP-binding protein [Sedimentisphaerales bacterium]NLT78572.1 sugar ABC transporter ATP-binding protein [Planctomycetota bacterium]